jgi:hypothetical protein
MRHGKRRGFDNGNGTEAGFSVHGQRRRGNYAVTITGYTGSATNIVIPGTINGLPVTAIGDYAFECNPVVSVTIGAGVDIPVRASGTFPGGLALVYANANCAAGTYTRSSADSTAWAKQ